MFAYLQKFNSLPPEIKEKVSSPAVSAKVAEIGKKYGVNLATVVIRVAVKDIPWSDLAFHLSSDFSLDQESSQRLVDELAREIFSPLSEYLGIVEIKSVSQMSVVAPAQIPTPERVLAEVNNASDKPLAQPVVTPNLAETAPVAPAPANLGLTGDVAGLVAQQKKQETTVVAEDYGDLTLLHNDRVNQILEMVVDGFRAEFSSAYFVERFKKIIFTYLRGVRDKINTRHSLMKPVENGGLGFDELTSDRIFKVADSHISELRLAMTQKQVENKDKFESEQKKVFDDSKKELPLRDVEYDLAKVLAQKKEEEKANIAPLSQVVDSVPAVATALIANDDVAASNPSPIVADAGKIEILPEKDLQPASTPNPISSPITVDGQAPSKPVVEPVVPTNPVVDDEGDVFLGLEAEIDNSNHSFGVISESSIKTTEGASPKPVVVEPIVKAIEPTGKRKVEDVKYVPRTMGPVEELLYMDLVTFHRLAKNPYDACDKIKAKIKLLEDDNYAKKIEGIRAWRQSYVNRLYLEIGQESIDKSKPVEIVIRERKEQNREYLTNEEFEAVMDLNRFLRF